MDGTFLKHISEVVIPHLDVLRLAMEYRIFREFYTTLVIAMDNCRL